MECGTSDEIETSSSAGLAAEEDSSQHLEENRVNDPACAVCDDGGERVSAALQLNSFRYLSFVAHKSTCASRTLYETIYLQAKSCTATVRVCGHSTSGWRRQMRGQTTVRTSATHSSCPLIWRRRSRWVAPALLLPFVDFSCS